MRAQGLLLALVALLAVTAPSATKADEVVTSTPPERAGAEKHEFQAEVNRLMDILIHSLYSNKDIFLRELISNAADALDKIRFLSLTDKSVLGEDDTAKLEIKIWLDKENNLLYIRDRGIGMTHEELVKNLGTIAKSGTSAFLEQMQKGGDVNLIGQFGVGFYSVYLVADWVEVVSKNNDDKQYIWSSTADGSFTIAEDSENEPLGRGTLIKIHLKEEAQEYAQEYKLRQLVEKYSEFMNFPIYLQEETEIDVPIEEEADEYEEAADEDDEEGVEDDDEEEGEEDDEPKTRKEKQLTWELVNDNKAIWLRRPSEVEDEEYVNFYKAISKAYDTPMSWSHFKAEGDVEFKTVLYIPGAAPFDFYDKYYDKTDAGSLKLYVRRVFISDDVNELIPRYLGFVKGIVDSDTLPLQVSREVLQQHDSLKTIKKKLVRKVLDMIKKMADDEAKCAAEPEEGDDEEERPSEEECGKFKKFWTHFGKAVKMGIIEDTTNRARLSKFLRFKTSKSGGKDVSLDDYVEGMKEGQKDIYFLAGKDMAELEKSPFVEKLLKKGYEVLYLTDVLDEYVTQHMIEYDGHKLSDASKDGMKMTDQDEKQKKRDKELKKEFKPLTAWWKEAVPGIESVKVSNRLDTTPCVVVASKYGLSANMERINKAQAFGRDAPPMGNDKKILEINPRHPLIKSLKEKVADDEDGDSNKELAKMLFETALLESGFQVADSKTFAQSVHLLLKDRMGIEGDLDAVEEEVEGEEEDDDDEEEEDEREGFDLGDGFRMGVEEVDPDNMPEHGMKIEL